MAPTRIPLSNIISARQATSDDSDNGHSTPVAAAVVPIVIGIVVFFLFCILCLRRRSRNAATHITATTNPSTNRFPMRRYNGGVVRNDTQNGEDGPPAYTSVTVPPPAYTPDQPPVNHARTDSNVEREPAHAAEHNHDTTTPRDEAPEEGKEPEHTA